MRSTVLAAPLACLLLIPASATARPAHKKALADYFGPFLAKKLNDCRTCHLPDEPDAEDDERQAAQRVRRRGSRRSATSSRKAGKKTDIAARLDAIADEDSDGDGVSNLLELLTGHFPGDAGRQADRRRGRRGRARRWPRSASSAAAIRGGRSSR